MTKNRSITTDEFDALLESAVASLTPSALLAIPGIYEILSEELNNDILTTWEEDHPEDDEDETDPHAVEMMSWYETNAR